MEWYNLKKPAERVTFLQAARAGLGQAGGLFLPARLDPLPELPVLLAMDFVPRSVRIMQELLADELEPEVIQQLVEDAFTFPAPLVPVLANCSALELFHGPTLAFKDFGARFMARVLSLAGSPSGSGRPLTILTATSGDTGAAIAHAFHGLPNARALILYPRGRISPLQEKLFCTLGGNIRTLSIDTGFDTCHQLVRHCLADIELAWACRLNSGNSINAARLLAQILYYFEAASRVPEGRPLVISVPCGNFGNLAAGLMARRLGLPLRAFVVACNENDTVPRYLATGCWEPRPARPTLSNAMDVGNPGNWPRVEALLDGDRDLLRAVTVNEERTRHSIRRLAGSGYLADPHTAVAFAALEEVRRSGEEGVFLATAHPAKFRESLQEILQVPVPLPPALAEALARPLLSEPVAPDPAAVRRVLLDDTGWPAPLPWLAPAGYEHCCQG